MTGSHVRFCRQMNQQVHCGDQAMLPDHYETVAEDVLEYAGPRDGIWLDVGSGAGGLGLAIAAGCQGTVVLLDPRVEALQSALKEARQRGLAGRVVAVVGVVEDMPLADASVDVAVSRGSIFFWEDRAQGLREIYRVLCPGGKAMVGGGLGKGYPRWARREFTRRRLEGVREKGPEALRRFWEARSPETFRRLAREAGLPSFEVIGEGDPDPPDLHAALGIWLRFTKEAPNER
jgi:ubiquinone/menaquinone biosynthesis C-methylase UbiE